MARQRSPLRVWFRDNFDAFSRIMGAMRADTGVDWSVLISDHIPKDKISPGSTRAMARGAWVREVEARERMQRSRTKARPSQPPRVVEHAPPQPAVLPSDTPKEAGGLPALEILKRERLD